MQVSRGMGGAVTKISALRLVLLACLAYAAAASGSCPGKVAGVCDTPVRTRADMPTLPADCTVTVRYVERLIAALGVLADIFSSYHSGLSLSVSCPGRPLPGGARAGVPADMTFQYYALDFPYGAVFPIQLVDGAQPDWNDTAIVTYTPAANLTDWDKVHTIGTMTAAAFNVWCDWVPGYAESHPGYELWSVWSATSVTASQKWYNETICDTFSQAALIAMYTAGADFAASAGLRLDRNYIAFITGGAAPTAVDLGDPAALQQVNDFWRAMKELLVSHRVQNISEFATAVADIAGGVVYVYDPPNDGYLRATLVAPFIGVDGIYQQMVLPWQSNGGGSSASTTKEKLSATDDAGIAIGALVVVLLLVVVGAYCTKCSKTAPNDVDIYGDNEMERWHSDFQIFL